MVQNVNMRMPFGLRIEHIIVVVLFVTVSVASVALLGTLTPNQAPPDLSVAYEVENGAATQFHGGIRDQIIAEESDRSGDSGLGQSPKRKRSASTRLGTSTSAKVLESQALVNSIARDPEDSARREDKNAISSVPPSRQSQLKSINTTDVTGDVFRASNQDKVCGGAPLRYLPFVKLTSSGVASSSREGPGLRETVIAGGRRRLLVTEQVRNKVAYRSVSGTSEYVPCSLCASSAVETY